MAQIAVIVPVYKVEPYLRRCVDSILEQTFTDFELILVDDGSPDNCGAICDEYAKKDSRVYVIHQENKGLSAARNAGIDWVFANSNSEWLNFVDSDDWVHPEYLFTLYDAVNTCNVKMAICDCEIVEEYTSAYTAEKVNPVIMTAEETFVSRNEMSIVAYAKLYHRTSFEQIRFPVGKICEDAFVTHRILLEQEYVAVCDTKLYYYFQRQDSILHAPWSVKRLDRIEAHECRLNDLKKKYPRAFKREMIAYFHVLAGEIVHVREGGPENKEFERLFCRKLRYVLVRYYKYLPEDIRGMEWIYETAFPKLMTIYWYKEAARKKLGRYIRR